MTENVKKLIPWILAEHSDKLRALSVKWDIPPDNLKIKRGIHGFYVTGRPDEGNAFMEGYLWRDGLVMNLAYIPTFRSKYRCGWYETEVEAKETISLYRENYRTAVEKVDVSVDPDKLRIEDLTFRDAAKGKQYFITAGCDKYLWADGLIRNWAIVPTSIGFDSDDILRYYQGWYDSFGDAYKALKMYRRIHAVVHEAAKYSKTILGVEKSPDEYIHLAYDTVHKLNDEQLSELDLDINKREFDKEVPSPVIVDNRTGLTLGPVDDFDIEFSDGEGCPLRTILSGAE